MFQPKKFLAEIERRNAEAGRLRRTEDQKLTRVTIDAERSLAADLDDVLFADDYIILSDYETRVGSAKKGTFSMIPAETVKEGRAHR